LPILTRERSDGLASGDLEGFLSDQKEKRQIVLLVEISKELWTIRRNSSELAPFSLDPIEAFLEKLLAEQDEDKVTLPDDTLRNGKDGE